METAAVIAIVFLALVVLVPVLFVWSSYNSLVSGKNSVEEAFSGVHVQLKRRTDLIPNLVETVKSYTKHERETLERLTTLRTEFLKIDPKDHSKVIEQDGMITQALKTVFAVAENYPELKASQNFLKMQESLEETEDQIAASRRIYNSNVRDYNTYLQQFPSNMVASKFGFLAEVFFKAEEADKAVPRVSF